MPFVKLPEHDQLSDREAQERTQLVHDYGALLLLWGQFEMTVEIKIAELAGMQPEKATIVLSPLMFGTKSDILMALLRQAGDEDAIKALNAVIQAGRRNALVHSVAAQDPKSKKFAFVRREIKGGYRVNNIEFDAEAFHQHFSEFRVLVAHAFLAMGFTHDLYYEDYVRKAGFYWPNP